MKNKRWCVWQDEDNEGVYCTAHIHEDRVLNCPYKNLEERQRADYPCQDYRPMDGGQDDATSDLESAVLENLKKAHINICMGCRYTYPECPAESQDALFGNYDNICACAKFKP